MVQVNQHDLEFILRQIKIAEANSIAHSGSDAVALTDIWVDELGNVVAEGTPGATLAISAEHVPYGLRTVNGSFNNLGEGRENWGATDQPFIELLGNEWRVELDDTFLVRTGANSFATIDGSYEPTGAVADADPRLISNLIVDQTLSNPAAIYTALQQAGYAGNILNAVTSIKTQFDGALVDAKLANGALAAGEQKTVAVLIADVTKLLAPSLEAQYGIAFDGPSLLIENVAPDEGLSAPYNSWFTLFGQFFDHGLDLVQKGGNDKIYIPLSPDDPLYVANSRTNYMTLTRAPETPLNLTTPFVDQNQTYSSVASKQLFLREYKLVDGKPVSTGHLLEGTKGIATWGEVKAQARDVLGIDLTDEYVGTVPLFLMDAYGEFVRGPNGYPQVRTANGWVEGNPDAPISLANAVLTNHAFLDDIAHNAVPGLVDHDRNPGTPSIMKTADDDDVAGNAIPLNDFGQATTYDEELLDAHFVTGDGRGNENIGLTAVHHIFHAEHNRIVEQVKDQAIAAAESGNFAFLNEWLSTDVTELPSDLSTLNWDGERLFQAARFTTEMQYQHLVFEEFARKIQPDVDAFVFNPSMDINPAIFAEFAHVVYRFGHSMLNETVDSVDADGNRSSMDLFSAFLNPIAYAPGDITAEQGAGAVIRGMTGQVGNEIDEFVTDVLRNHLVGIPLDLAALNIARGRETGIPGLNAARAQFQAIANGDTQLDPYKSWVDFGMNLKNPASIVNFIAAYGTHATIANAATAEAKRDAAMKLVFGGDGAPTDRLDFLNGTGAYTNLGGLNDVDLWVGGLAEKKMAFGGMLGSTFSFIFELQLENLQNGDRFYYLSRTQGLNLLNELEANSFAELVIRNTDIGDTGYAVPGDIFSVPDHVLYVDPAQQAKWGYTDPTGDDPFQNALSPVVERAANYIKYHGLDHVLIQGTNEADTIVAGGGDDTVWGRGGNDRIEAGYGVDKIHGGEGDDIITNSGTDIGETDFLMGEEGNDVVHGGSGLALVFGNQGSDVLIAGPDGKEMFGGEGDDFMLGGEGGDFLLGNEGDDWIEGGNGFDTTAGDNSELFFNSTIIGHDVMFAGENEHDFDAESGDDIMVQGESVMRNEGMWGYDWAIYKGNTENADADLKRPIFTTDQQDILRNRFDAVEGLSGYKQNDVLLGDDRASAFLTPDPAEPEAEPGANLAGAENTMVKHHLSQAGIDRIAGLRELLGNLVQNTTTVGEAAREAEIAFDDGNILLGGGGSDLIEGRGGDDVIDGDAWLNVRIRISTPSAVYTADSLAGPVYLQSQLVKGEIPANTAPAFGGKALSDLLLARTITPGQMEIVREIVDGGQSGDNDVAVYSDIRANYSIVQNDDGTFTVSHLQVDPAGALDLVVSDGVDRIRNVEVLRFADGDVSLTPPKLYLQTPSVQYADNFDTASHTNNNGNASWASAWTETNDLLTGNIVTGGQIQIDGNNSNQLRFVGSNTADGAQIERSLDLSGATTALLSYSIDENGLDVADNDTVRVLFSADGSEAGFQLVDLITGTTGEANRSITLTGPFEADAKIRFVSSALGNNEDVRIDNLRVTFTTAPVVNYETTFTEDGADQNLASSPVIVENDQIVSARIVLTNAQAGDSFDIPGNLPGNINSAVDTSVAGRITVTLTGNEPQIGLWQAAIQAIQFRNNSESPSTVDRIVEITVNDGLFNSNVATTTINVVSVNDVPVAVDDNIVTNITGPITIPSWLMLRNDSDAEGSPLAVTNATENNNNFSITFNSGTVVATRTNAGNHNFTYTVSDGAATSNANVAINWDTTGPITGNNGANIILGNGDGNIFNGNGGNDLIIAGAGNDIVDGGTGDDEVVWNVGDGRDFVNGGTGNDTIVINGDASDEVFRIYSVAEALAAGMSGFNAATEIVITRGGTTNADVVAELDNIEEIIINTGAGNDQVIPIGNFNPTSLNFNTITINGSAGNDTVDISDLASAHRILFRSAGGQDTIIGTLRSQDVVEIPEGADPAEYTLIVNANGTKTLSNGGHSITFTGDVPQLEAPGSSHDEGDPNPVTGPTGPFEYTARDIAGITNLVKGLPAFAGDDDTEGAGGVRDLSGNGNNVDNPAFGSADEPFIRLTEARYGDGVVTDAQGQIINRAINPIFDGLDPRAISQAIGQQEADLPKAPNDANIFFMAFGQYFDHGLDFLPKGGAGKIFIDGADVSGPTAANFADLTRGTLANPLESATDTPEHLNKTSPYVDQNQVYGSNVIVGQLLRESDGDGGVGSRILMGPQDPSAPDFQLMSTLRELLDHHREAGTVFKGGNLPAEGITIDAYYPTLWNSQTNSYDAAVVRQLAGDFMGSSHALILDANPMISLLDHYVGGDGRANENFTLTSMHTIWARNHNFHVEKLQEAGFEGTSEELFQAAKMVNEAEYQRVVFTEFADALIGGIQGTGDHGFEGYNDQATASISHEFAAAVYRIGHSLIGDTVTVKGPDGENYSVNLFDAFLNPTNDVFTPAQIDQLRAMGYDPQPGYEQLGTGAILSGIVEQPAEDVDFNVVDAVRNDLVRIRADLFAFNVARGRDVGLGTLNQVKADLKASTDPYIKFAVEFLEANGGSMNPYSSWQDFQQRNGLSDVVLAQFIAAYPDLVLQASQIDAFKAINGNIVSIQEDGTGLVKGIDRVDLWVGGLAEKHFNGGMAGDTFWVVLHEQFDRLQEADRFYYLQRFDNFDLYENFIDGQNFSDIVARNTGLTGLPEDIFSSDVEDGANGDGDGNADGDGDDDGDGQTGNDGDGDDDGNTGGDDGEDDEDEEDGDSDGSSDGNGEDDGDGSGDGDGAGSGSGTGTGGGTTPTPVPVAALTLIGTAAADALLGAAGNDTILGGAGTDILVGQAGSDILRGEEGDDVITGGDGDDYVNAGLGDDEVHSGDGKDIVFGGAGSDQIFAGAGNDVIEGGAGDDRIWAGEGDDNIIATLNDGADVYYGEAGVDTLDYAASGANLTVDLGNGFNQRGSVSGGTTGSDTFYGFENFIGGSGHDTITASTAVNVIDGGLGDDVFKFTSAASAHGDTIYGFQTGDRIDFTGMGAMKLEAGTTIDAIGDVTITHEIRDGEEFTIIRGNTQGDNAADFELSLHGRHNLTINDFLGVS